MNITKSFTRITLPLLISISGRASASGLPTTYVPDGGSTGNYVAAVKAVSGDGVSLIGLLAGAVLLFMACAVLGNSFWDVHKGKKTIVELGTTIVLGAAILVIGLLLISVATNIF